MTDPLQDPSSREQLQAVASPWTEGRAVALFLALTAGTLLAGLAAAALRLSTLGEPADTLLLSAALLAGYALAPWLAWRWVKRAGMSVLSALDERRATLRTYLMAAVVVTVAGRFAAWLWGALLEFYDINVPGMDTDPTTLFSADPLGVVMIVLVVCVAAPIAEELVFRGAMIPALSPRLGTAASVGISATTFALLHLTAASIPPVFVLGLVLGAIRARTGSTTVVMVAHAAFNASGLALIYVLKAMGVM